MDWPNRAGNAIVYVVIRMQNLYILGNVRNMIRHARHIVYLSLLSTILLVPVSCNRHGNVWDKLTAAEQLMEDKPDSALVLLSQYESEKAHWCRADRMYYELVRLKAENKAGITFVSDSAVKEVVKYYDLYGTSNEKMLARYLLGRALSDLGEAPEALQAFYDGIAYADTLRKDCDYGTLATIFGQMSQIFHYQNLPQDEIWALNRYVACVEKSSDKRDAVIAKSQLIRPYYLLGEKDTVLKIIEDTYKSLQRFGDSEKAVSAFGTAIYIYTERKQLEKARRAVDIFERESGLFDKNGKIAKGREGYYFIKGKYELALGKIDSAEIYYRKAISYGYLSEGYKGLLHIYREKNVMDSVIHFSRLYEAAQDTIHNRMQTYVIHQMSSLYNYGRKQQETEIERENSRTTRLWAVFSVVIAIGLVGNVLWFYKQSSKKKKLRIKELERGLIDARKTRAEILEELQHLKDKDYESVIAAKECKLEELTETIEYLQVENEAYKEGLNSGDKDNIEHFLESDIAALFVKKATEKTEKVQTTETEWKKLMAQFGKDNPVTFKSFGSGKALSKLEQRICVLLILEIPENIISIMANTSASTISNSKARANEKLFGKKDAHPLKINLISCLRSS